MPRIAKVEPLTTARGLRGPFDYLLGLEWEQVDVGTVLEVPFGRRQLLGVVTGIAADSEIDPERLAEPVRLIGDGVPPELIDLAGWVAAEYCSTFSRALGLVTAPGTGTAGEKIRVRQELRASLTPGGRAALNDSARLGVRQRAVLEALAAAEPLAGTEALAAAEPPGPGHPGELSSAELAERAGADRASLRRLESRELIVTREVTVRRAPATKVIGKSAASPPELTDAQHAASERLSGVMARREGEPERILLHGVTGSGKTEVYLAAVEAALSEDRGAIILVPEIGLTPQAVARFRARLGERIAVLHSALKPRERFDEWSRLRSGEARVCVGPRSAVFAPVRDLGMIVIDEEHDPSYKQENDPRYDARDVARRRMEGRGGALICGTATPRPESWLAMERVDLPERVDGRPMPPVSLIDMREADPRSGPLHERTLEALDAVRRRGEKSIVLINRRGFAPWLTCRSCGHHWGCPHCDVSLITHRDTGRLVCHHCAHIEPLPRACPECGSVTLARSGAGTQRLEEALAGHLGGAPVFRLDADSASRPGGHGEILERFARSDAGVLVGTQMVAKGHDFHDVTLSVIVDADATLRFPDFRAEERTFALVTQLAGRSGRGEAGGEVIVQTLAPGAPSIAHAAHHDAAGFLTGEIERRRVLRYPPFSHLIRVVLASPDQPRLARASTQLRERLSLGLPEDAELLGPAPMFRLRGKHRRRLLIKATERAPAVAVTGEVVATMAAGRELREVAISVDVDPQ